MLLKPAQRSLILHKRAMYMKRMGQPALRDAFWRDSLSNIPKSNDEKASWSFTWPAHQLCRGYDLTAARSYEILDWLVAHIKLQGKMNDPLVKNVDRLSWSGVLKAAMNESKGLIFEADVNEHRSTFAL